MSERLLVTFNAGSSTVKIGLFALAQAGPKRIGKGVIDLRDLVYFVLTIVVWLYASTVVIDMKKAA